MGTFDNIVLLHIDLLNIDLLQKLSEKFPDDPLQIYGIYIHFENEKLSYTIVTPKKILIISL